MLDFKAVLDKQGVPAEMMRGTVPLDMSQYSKLFTTARYPQQGEDYVMTTPRNSENPPHALFSCPCGSRCAPIDCHFRA